MLAAAATAFVVLGLVAEGSAGWLGRIELCFSMGKEKEKEETSLSLHG